MSEEEKKRISEQHKELEKKAKEQKELLKKGLTKPPELSQCESISIEHWLALETRCGIPALYESSQDECTNYQDYQDTTKICKCTW